MPKSNTISATQFYLYAHGVEAGGVPKYFGEEREKRQAIAEALEQVRRTATEMGCFVDLTHEHMLLEAIDMSRLLSHGGTP